MQQLLTRTIDARPLAASRILVGFASLPLIVEWSRPLIRAASPDYLAVPLLDGLPPLTPIVAYVLIGIAVISGLCMLLGIMSRLSSLGVAATASVVMLIDQQTYTNHLLLMVLIAAFIGMSGAGSAWAVGARKGGAWVPYWPAFLIKAQITTLYGWTAISKINPEYLSGAVLEEHLRPWLPFPDEFVYVLAYASIFCEALLAIALWVPRVRVIGFLLGAGLHLGIIIMLSNTAPLILFVLLVLPAYLLFLYDEMHRGRVVEMGESSVWSPPRRVRSATEASGSTGA